MRDNDIAAILNMRRRHVEDVVRKLLDKFKVSNRTELAWKALMRGYEIDWIVLENTSTGELDWLLYPEER